MRFLKLLVALTSLIIASNSVADERVQFTASSEYALSNADYRGVADLSGTQWTGDLGVQIFSDRPTEIPVLPSNGVLASISVDGKPAAVFPRQGHFKVLVQGKGTHAIQIRFNVPIEEQGGLATVKLGTVETPVTRYQLTIPGEKEVRVTPNAVLERTTTGGKTVVTVNMPMNREVGFSWSNILADGKNTIAQLHATLYHFALPEEGVLSLRTLVSYELLRGEISTAEIQIPQGFEVTRVQSPGFAINYWRVAKEPTPTLFVIFQDPVKSNFTIDCTVERSLAKIGDPNAKMTIEPLRAKDAARERGIIALLAGKDVALSPVDERLIMRVGENQIPANIRGLIEQNVLHTFKYLDDSAGLSVNPTTPEKKVGRFDALVHSLFSLGDVSIKGSVKTHIQVKAGAIQEVSLSLPKGISVLSVNAPSIRNFNVEPVGDKQRILVQFTQDMDGTFPIDVQFERLLASAENEPNLPTLHVEGAEVEQGKFAIEALTAVEVQAGAVHEFAPIELTEVPQEIMLQTSNPLLLAFKYPRLEEKASLTLKVTRHQEIETQPAVVDQAQYDTLVTADGMSVTTAHYTVRNTKSQFLRLLLPRGTTIWSTTVQGQNVKPARADHEGEEETLIKIINSPTPFLVDITYATPQAKMLFAGFAHVGILKTDLVVTRTSWNLFMPEQFAYGPAHTNMALGASPQVTRQEDLQQFGAALKSGQSAAPFAVTLPTGGVRYTFNRLLSTEAERADGVNFAYLSRGYRMPQWISFLSAFALALIGLGMQGKLPRLSSRTERMAALIAGATLGIMLTYFGTGYNQVLMALLGSVVWVLIPEGKRRLAFLRRVEA